MFGHHFHKKNFKTTVEAVTTEAKEYGSTTGQIYLTNNRTGALLKSTGDLSDLPFPVFVHSAYTNSLWTKSKKQVESIKAQLDLCEKHNLLGLVFHHGKKTPEQILAGVKTLPKTKAKILLEQTAAKAEEGKTFGTPESLNTLIDTMEKGAGDYNWGLVLDTSHLWALGTDLSTSDKVKKFLGEIKKPKYISLIHFNGSIMKFASGRDCHLIPAEPDDKIWDRDKRTGWKELMKWCKSNKVPMTMEVNRGDLKHMKHVYEKY